MSSSELIHISGPFLSNRLAYVLNWVFKEQGGINYVFTAEPTLQTYKLTYNNKSVVLCPCSEFLAETQIVEHWLETFNSIFQKRKTDSNYDWFAAIFFCLSRYEEYFYLGKVDNHKRFSAKKSILFSQENNMVLPWVDEILLELNKVLTPLGCFTALAENKEKNKLTIDLDIGLLFAGKGVVRSLGGALKDALWLNFEQLSKRMSTWFKPQNDPLWNLPEKLKPYAVFVPLNRFNKFDRNLTHKSKAYKNLLLRWQQNVEEIGLHPSYDSSIYKYLTEKECGLFNAMFGSKPSASRQHFLRFSIKETLPMLAEMGVEKEYSMGYSNVLGFRAGTGRSFPFFDLQENEAKNIYVVPFALMDSTLFSLPLEKGLRAAEKLNILARTTKSPVTLVWHDWTAIDYGPGAHMSLFLRELLKIFNLNDCLVAKE
ncbi:MAG: DUF7033 domain-containing protein [Luteibaculaceae bacterium]